MPGNHETRRNWTITPVRLITRCEKIKERGAAAPAVHAREIVLQVFRFIQARGLKVENPAEAIRPSAIATFKARHRAPVTDRDPCVLESRSFSSQLLGSTDVFGMLVFDGLFLFLGPFLISHFTDGRHGGYAVAPAPAHGQKRFGPPGDLFQALE